MKSEELTQLYSTAKVEEIPYGDSKGTAMLFPNLWFSGFRSWCMGIVWRGKVIDKMDSPAKGKVINKLTLWNAIKADAYLGDSLLDEKPSIIIDYAKKSFFFKNVQDEIREVSPGIYLGKMYWRPWFGGTYSYIWFVLDFTSAMRIPDTL
jgi:hypothetical protein